MVFSHRLTLIFSNFIATEDTPDLGRGRLQTRITTKYILTQKTPETLTTLFLCPPMTQSLGHARDDIINTDFFATENTEGNRRCLGQLFVHV